jgi:hypothetical protein
MARKPGPLSITQSSLPEPTVLSIVKVCTVQIQRRSTQYLELQNVQIQGKPILIWSWSFTLSKDKDATLL